MNARAEKQIDPTDIGVFDPPRPRAMEIQVNKLAPCQCQRRIHQSIVDGGGHLFGGLKACFIRDHILYMEEELSHAYTHSRFNVQKSLG